MKLVMLYGPPAAGKLTVATYLKDLTGFKLFHNHMIVNNIAELFPFEDSALAEVRGRVGRQIRLDIFEAAAQAGVSFITTFGQTHSNYYDFFRDIKKRVEAAGGQVVFVQLMPSKQALLERVESYSRKGIKLDSRERLELMIDSHEHVMSTFPDVEHLIIDNTNISPEDCAQEIYEHLAD